MSKIINIILKKVIKKLRHLDIFKRLIISSLIVILIPNTLIGFFSFSRFSTEIDSTIASYSYKTLYSLNKSFKERLSKYSELAYSLNRNNTLRDLLSKCAAMKNPDSNITYNENYYTEYKKEIGFLLNQTSRSLDGIVNIEIVSDTDEFIQINPVTGQVGAKIRDLSRFRNTEYYKNSLETAAFKTFIWWDTSKENTIYEPFPYTSAYLGEYITLLKAIPVTGAEGNLGVIVMNIALESLTELFSFDDPYMQKGDLILLSDSGIIKYFDPNIYSIKLDADIMKEILNLNKDNIVRTISNEEYLISVIKSDYTGWSLCNFVPRSSLLKSVYEIRNLIVRIGLICVAVAFIMSYIVALSISRPIKKLKNTMGKVDENNIDIIYNDDFNDEVGVLGKKFNSMIRRIQNLINTVYEAELNKKEENLRRKQAELDALQMQINPHFLYNTLDIIRWQVMADENGESKSSKMISAFSDLLRLGTKRSSNLVPISEEIDHIKAYIEVVRFDLEYELQVIYNINDDIKSCKIPKFTFQPLIENVLVHGFAHKQGNGTITIDGYIENNEIIIKIIDNGEGISSDVLDAINNHLDTIDTNSSSIGLRNVNERIKLYFGEHYGLKIMSTLGENTTALILIPLINN